tara:strand:+ start:257 stop:958 length:702 start_codon:yes stop_codon:yes gene_type:complete
MNKLLTRGGIEIIAVFIGISGGLWSEKQIELNKTLKVEKIALKSIRDEFVSDSTKLFGTASSIENEQKEISVFLKHISGDTSLSDEKLNSLIFEMIYFRYFTYDKSVYESLIKGSGKKIIQNDSVSSSISSIYEATYKHLENVFDMQKDLIATRTYDAFVESGGYLDTKRFSISKSLDLNQNEMFSRALKDKKFITQVSFHYDTNYFILNQYKWALKEVKATIGVIDNYLGNS